MMMNKAIGDWRSVGTVDSLGYVCGYCGNNISSEKAYTLFHVGNVVARAYICHKCNRPTFIKPGEPQTPGPMLGEDIENLPDDVQSIYNEIRRAISVGSNTAAVLVARKLPMHIAVANKAPENKNFVEYVKYLADNGHIHPKSKKWVDTIRKKGNEANHEIKLMSTEDAKEILKLVELILLFNYQYADIETSGTPESI